MLATNPWKPLRWVQVGDPIPEIYTDDSTKIWRILTPVRGLENEKAIRMNAPGNPDEFNPCLISSPPMEHADDHGGYSYSIIASQTGWLCFQEVTVPDKATFVGDLPLRPGFWPNL
jgi:hypothetical protein